MKKVDLSRLGEPWMPCPKIVISEYPSLDYLCPINELIVAKKVDTLHDIIGYKGHGYTIFNNEGQKIFLAVQKRKCRKFKIKIFNYYGNEVIEIKKPFNFCTNKVLVWSPPGNFVGFVEQGKGCKNQFLVKNKLDQTVLMIDNVRGSGYTYDVLSEDKLIGKIKKEWRVMNFENFGVSFPTQMDVGDKAVLLGACFLIGYLKY